MGLCRTAPVPSARMGALWCLSGVSGAAVVEYGCMGHGVYGRTFLDRWGSQGAQFFSTHLSETDIALGSSERLDRAVDDVIAREAPGAVFLLPSSTPEVIGFDLGAAALELRGRHPGVPVVAVETGGFDRHVNRGVEQALLCLVRTLTRDVSRTQGPSFNVIGACADLLACVPDAREATRLMEGAFCAERVCCLSADTSVTEVGRAGAARVNLVLRQEGVACARELERRFGTPWVLGRPYGVEGTRRWLGAVGEALGQAPDQAFVQEEAQQTDAEARPMRATIARFAHMHAEAPRVTLVGHADVVAGIARFVTEELGLSRVEAYCDDPDRATEEVPFATDEVKREVAGRGYDLLLGTGELRQMAGGAPVGLISLPDDRWHHVFEPPLLGFRGAVHLTSLMANAIVGH